MPNNPVTDPITDQEMAFAHLILAGTMNDRRAAEAVGLNPDTAASTKSQPRVRDYMIEHRAPVREKLVDQEPASLRQQNLGRVQVLARLWELANLSFEVTKGSISGQVKALAMIVAIEGLIPDRRHSASAAQPASPVQPSTGLPAWLRRQPEAEATQPAATVPAVEAQPSAPQAPKPEPPPKPASHAPAPNLARNHSGAINPFVHPSPLNRVSDAFGLIYDALLSTPGPLTLSLPPRKDPSARGR